MAFVKEGFIAEGATCRSCKKIIIRQAMKVDGVKDAGYNYETETGFVVFDDTKTDIDKILDSIEKKNYTCFMLDDSPIDKKRAIAKKAGWIIGIVGVITIGFFLFNYTDGINMPQISQNMSYALLFLVGLLTGLHCIAMCGGFVVSYTAVDAKNNRSSWASHAIYGAAKTLSYTIIGAIFGLIGSIIAFTPLMRGIAGILAGLFLITFGLKTLNIFPPLRRFSIRMPAFISRFAIGKKASNPLVIGLLNGLMIACGPLQAIYIMAAGTGSMLEGAKLLLIFGLGTLPAMLGFGLFTTFISKKLTTKIAHISGAVIIVLGLLMLNNGLVLTGTGYDAGSLVQRAGLASTGQDSSVQENIVYTDQEGFQEIYMEVNRQGWSPDRFVLQKDVLVRWVIEGKEINGCNNAIVVPGLGLEFDIMQGTQVIEFTPEKEGVIRWSCWMGMIPGMFIIEDAGSGSSSKEEKGQELEEYTLETLGSCEGSCGGGCDGSTCGCGG